MGIAGCDCRRFECVLWCFVFFCDSMIVVVVEGRERERGEREKIEFQEVEFVWWVSSRNERSEWGGGSRVEELRELTFVSLDRRRQGFVIALESSAVARGLSTNRVPSIANSNDKMFDAMNKEG